MARGVKRNRARGSRSGVCKLQASIGPEGHALLGVLASGRLAAVDPVLAEELRQKVAELFGVTAMWLRREGHDGEALQALLPVLERLNPTHAKAVRELLALAWAGAASAMSADRAGNA